MNPLDNEVTVALFQIVTIGLTLANVILLYIVLGAKEESWNAKSDRLGNALGAVLFGFLLVIPQISFAWGILELVRMPAWIPVGLAIALTWVALEWFAARSRRKARAKDQGDGW